MPKKKEKSNFYNFILYRITVKCCTKETLENEFFSIFIVEFVNETMRRDVQGAFKNKVKIRENKKKAIKMVYNVLVE